MSVTYQMQGRIQGLLWHREALPLMNQWYKTSCANLNVDAVNIGVFACTYL